jgi:hypothetical protein
MRVGVGFEESRPVPPGWQEMLDREFNNRENLSRIIIRWESGDPWAPVERWNLWQLLPVHRAPDHILRPMLEGPSPREFARWDANAGRMIRFKKGGPMISLAQWLAFREYDGRYIPIRYWTLQGDPEEGGHKVAYNRVEKMISKAKGGTGAPPVNGDLDYIPFGEATMRKLRMIDRIQMNTLALDHYLQNADQYDRREEEAVLRMQEEVWKFLGERIETHLDTLTKKQLMEAGGMEDPIRVFQS